MEFNRKRNTTNQFKWSIKDIENLLNGTKNLLGSSNYLSYDNNELIVNKPNFINSLISQIISQHDSELQDHRKKVIGCLRWLLNQSMIYKSKSNDETEATMYFYVKLIIPLKVKMN